MTSADPTSPRREFDRQVWVVLLALLLGVAFRIALAFPTYKYSGDADCIMTALCADKVLSGRPPLFFSPGRVGALGGYLAALLFALFGETRGALAAGPVIVDSLQLFAWYLFLREVLGKRVSLNALPFIVVLSPAVAFWTLMPNGYPEIMLLSTTTLWLACRIGNGDERALTLAGFWLAGGLAGFQSLLTLGCSLPSIAWLSWRRPVLWRRRGWWLMAVGGTALAVFPQVVFHVALARGLVSKGDSIELQAGAGLRTLIDNIRFAVSYDLRELVASTSTAYSLSSLQPRLAWCVIAVHVAAALFFFAGVPILAWRARWPPCGLAAPPLLSAWVLFSAVMLGVIGLKAVSSIGNGPFTVRYVLPIVLLVPGLLAVCLHRLINGGRAGNTAAWTISIAVLAFDVVGSNLPGASIRRMYADRSLSDQRLISRLRQEKVNVVVGSFWIVYPIDWLSGRQILGPPMEPLHDKYRIADQIPQRPVRWALVAHDAERLERWAECAGIAGHTGTLDSFYSLFLPRTNPPEETSGDFLRRISTSYRATQRPDPLHLRQQRYSEEGRALWNRLRQLNSWVAASERWDDGWFPGDAELTLLIRDVQPGDLRLQLLPCEWSSRQQQSFEMVTRSGQKLRYWLDPGVPQWVSVHLTVQDIDLPPGASTGWARLRARAQSWVPSENQPPIEDCRRLGVRLNEVALGPRNYYHQ